MFSVSVRNSSTCVNKTFEGYIFKKGNKKNQGYAKRWLKIDNNGSLQYLKSASASSVKSSIVLSQAAVRINHDRLLIDIDNGQNLLHFKALDKKDFEKIISVIEGCLASLEQDPSSINLPLAAQFLPSSDLLLQQINILTDKIEKLALDNSANSALIESAYAVHAAAICVKDSAINLKSGYEMALHQTELLLEQAIYDNNQIRRQHGMEQISSDHLKRSRRESFFSTSEIFYDAEQDEILSAEQEEFVLEQVSEEEEIDDEKEGFQSRRKCLPSSTVSLENISLLGILRNNVGKDLSAVAMPLALNEPLNLLQRLCEELEYSDLLERANQSADPIERLLLVSAFAVSGYASTINRSGLYRSLIKGRKPFNPLLGETFEYVRPDLGIKFMSEKVCHQPPVMACHASSSHYIFFQESSVKTKFWGKSMELVPSGTVHVILKATGEHFTWTKVTTCMRNIFSNARYLEHYGSMSVKNNKLMTSVSLLFKESGYFTSAKNEVSGFLLNGAGEKVCNLIGRWDDTLNMYYDSKPDFLHVLWKARPAPQNQADMYGFSEFAVELNEMTPDIEHFLPCTDTRFRSDQRMLENGLVELAEQEKLRLEQKQREKRNQGEKWVPRWFQKIDSPYEDGEHKISWQVIGEEYWQARSSKNWGDLADLF